MCREVRRQAVSLKQRGFAQAWPGQTVARAGSQRGDLQDQRGRLLRRFVRARRQRGEIGQRQRHGERGLIRCVDDRGAAVKRQPIARRRSVGIEPQRRLVIDQREQHRRRRWIERRWRCEPPARLMQFPWPRHRIQHGTECRLCLTDRIGKTGQRDRRAHVRMFRMAKNCTRVAAAFAATVSRRACWVAASGSIISASNAACRSGSCSSASASAASSA